MCRPTWCRCALPQVAWQSRHAAAGSCVPHQLGFWHRRGDDPEADAAEKALLRTARRGVVQLFNAVAKAQKQAAEAQAPGARAKVRSQCSNECELLQLQLLRTSAKPSRDDAEAGPGLWGVVGHGVTLTPPGPTASLHRLQDKQLTKASFLAELRGKSAQQRRAAGGAAATAQGSAPSEQAAAGDAPAWRALQDDMASLQSGLRMKVGTCCPCLP